MRRRRARPTPNPRGPFARRLGRAFAVLVRVLAVLLAMQLSGAAHALHDVVELVSAPASSEQLEQHEDCDDEGDKDCPPGSASCHRTHHNVMPSATSRELLAALGPCPLGELAGLGYDALAPPRPDPTSLERPPRLLLAS